MKANAKSYCLREDRMEFNCFQSNGTVMAVAFPPDGSVEGRDPAAVGTSR